MAQKHIAKTGKLAGTWVTCTVARACRNGGRHISSEALETISSKTYTPMNQLTEQDVELYLQQNETSTPVNNKVQSSEVKPKPVVKYTSCKDCGAEDPTRLYRSGKMRSCKDCQNYANIVTKSAGKCEVGFNREEFLAWKHGSEQRCHYCQIDEKDIYDANIVNTRTKKRCEAMGADRLDSDKGYTFDNIVLCCPGCNAFKSNNLSEAEMLTIGPMVRKIWEDRKSSQKLSELAV